MTQVDIPRPEYPRPQFEREDWVNLNGQWTFAFDPGKSGMDAGRRLFRSEGFDDEITVPFCPECPLSGVGHVDFIEAMWYHRTIAIPENWIDKRILLHFGAVDYESELFIDGVSVGTHFGGTVSFSHDITAYVRAGESHNLVLRVFDDVRSGTQPGGKQNTHYRPWRARYSRTTGIWQTVWMEAADPCGLKDIHIVPDLDSGRFIVTPTFHDLKQGLSLKVTLKAGEIIVAEGACAAVQNGALVLELEDPRPWSPDDPFLYGMILDVTDSAGRLLDSVTSYAGLRKVHIEGNQVFLNNRPLYQRLVLDQGFYPEGTWTAPSDGALKRDIELSMAAGFNGARLHQKVFEERFHYWADRLGYLTWGESSSWGCDVNNPVAARNFLTEWGNIVVRDRNHPSIIAWTPFNETWSMTDKKQHHRLHRDGYDLCKLLDPTRPVNETSGFIHVKTDLWTVHTYEQDPEALSR
ncbi:MAG: sugar-binding domain-containing protein, partial [Desulfobacterales bacterium]